MNKIIIPVLASILILGVLGTAQDAFAPKKLFVGGLSWDAETQSFVITGTVHHGMAKAIENAGFTLEGILFNDEVISWSLPFNTDIIIGPDPLTGTIASQPIFWDRVLDNGELFEGRTDVTIEAQILNPAGKPVATAEPLTVNLNITPPTPTTCESDRDCTEGSSCVFGVCVPDNAPPPTFCEDDTDCPGELVCRFGLCLPF